MKRSHYAGGVILWNLTAAVFPVHAAVALAGIPIAREMALWPDWDHDRATMVYRYGKRSLHLRRQRGKWRVVVHRHPGKVAQKVARWVERRFGGHRAGTHSLLVGPLLCGVLAGLGGLVAGLCLVGFTGVVAGFLWPLVACFAGAGAVGALSHTLLDLVTCNCGGCDPKPPRHGRVATPWSGRHRAGCEVLWPLVRRRFGVGLFPVGSDYEKQRVIPALELVQVVSFGVLLASWYLRWRA